MYTYYTAMLQNLLYTNYNTSMRANYIMRLNSVNSYSI